MGFASPCRNTRNSWNPFRLRHLSTWPIPNRYQRSEELLTSHIGDLE